MITWIIQKVFLLCFLIVISSSNPLDENECDLPYWKQSIVYQIYPRSFKDSDGDGVGDLQGIRSKVPYLKELGVEIVWLSPIYESPMADFGYDISNYTNIEPTFGTMEDFDQLVDTLHFHGLKIVLDFVPNHTSNLHDWFIRSSLNEPQFKDYYIWTDPKGFDQDGEPIPPNNWVSAFRYSSWEWVEARNQFYYHHYLKEQPDLNFRNPKVGMEIKETLRFWLDRGVDGFRIDAIRVLFEVEDIYDSNEPAKEDSGTTDPTQHAYHDHIYTANLAETYRVVREWRELLDEYETKRIMMMEYSNQDNITLTMMYYGNQSLPLADFPFNFNLIERLPSRHSLTGVSLKAITDLWMNNMPEGKWPNWVLGNHDQHRVASRLGSDVADALNMFVLLLPGTPVTYYGEEIGMEDTVISYKDGQDPSGCHQGPEGYANKSRDFNRTPMQWDSSLHAGFTTGNDTWLPINQNYVTINVETERKASQSSLKVYQSLAKLRKNRTFQRGLLSYPIVSDDILAFVRNLDGEPSYMIILNLSERPLSVSDYTLNFRSTNSSEKGIIIIRSSGDNRDETKPGTEVELSKLSLISGEGLVIRFDNIP